MRSNPFEANDWVVNVPAALLNDRASLPSYSRSGDAGLDLRTTESFDLAPFERRCIPTGFALAIPEGYVLPRSGLAAKHGISIVNAPGLIDSNYRGEILVTLVNLDAHETFHAEAGDRIAQLVISPVPFVELHECSSLSETERGAAGFGSSGVS